MIVITITMIYLLKRQLHISTWMRTICISLTVCSVSTCKSTRCLKYLNLIKHETTTIMRVNSIGIIISHKTQYIPSRKVWKLSSFIKLKVTNPLSLEHPRAEIKWVNSQLNVIVRYLILPQLQRVEHQIVFIDLSIGTYRRN